MKILFFILLSIITSFSYSQSKHLPADSKKLSSDKGNRIDNLLNKELDKTLGLAVAVIKDGQVIYKNYLGKKI